MPWLPYARVIDRVPRPYLRLWREPGEPFSALIDSGSDDSSIPLGLASSLGIRFDPDRPRGIFGAGGYYREWIADDDIDLHCPLGPLVLRRPALNSSVPFIILGRSDAFAAYRFAFDQRALRFQVDPYS